MSETMLALNDVGVPVLMLWPNADAGSDDTARGDPEVPRAQRLDSKFHFFKNLPFETYIQLMDRTALPGGKLQLGHSGRRLHRHAGRERGLAPAEPRTRRQRHRSASHDRKSIAEAIPPSRSRHQGNTSPRRSTETAQQAGERIAEILSTAKVDIQKVMTY